MELAIRCVVVDLDNPDPGYSVEVSKVSVHDLPEVGSVVNPKSTII